MTRQRGMSLVVALFLIVVVALLAAFAVTVGGAQRQSKDLYLLSNRALAAARSGLEWGRFRTRTNWCASQTLSLTEGALRGFRVTVQCLGPYPHTESGIPYSSYDLTATSQYGTFGSADFVSRRVTAREFSTGY